VGSYSRGDKKLHAVLNRQSHVWALNGMFKEPHRKSMSVETHNKPISNFGKRTQRCAFADDSLCHWGHEHIGQQREEERLVVNVAVDRHRGDSQTISEQPDVEAIDSNLVQQVNGNAENTPHVGRRRATSLSLAVGHQIPNLSRPVTILRTTLFAYSAIVIAMTSSRLSFRWLLPVICSTILVSCTSTNASETRSTTSVTPTSDAARASAETPTFKPHSCGFEAPGLTEGTDWRCGIVTSSMSKGSKKVVSLFVTVIGEPATPKDDPIVHLAGGPGASSESYAPILGSFYSPLSKATGRQIIFIDQRGTGRSEPFLNCADLKQAKACLKEWSAAGIDPKAFTTTYAADDVAAVLESLKIPQATIWGASYGSRLALEVARRHPSKVRALVIESVDTADTPLKKVEGVKEALRRIGDACAQDPSCVKEIPDLVGLVESTAVKLKTEPLTTLLGPVDVTTFVTTTLNIMEASIGSSLVPLWLKAVSENDVPAMEAVLLNLASEPPLGGKFSTAMNALTNCSDIKPFSPSKVLKSTKPKESLFDTTVWEETLADFVAGCAPWPVDSNGPTEAVSSTIPTLLLGGSDDSNTPLLNAAQAAKTLPSSQLVAVPGYGHFPLHRGDNQCTAKIFSAFVEQPTAAVDQTCLIPAKVRMSIPTTVELVLTDLPALGVRIGLPKDWLTAGPAGRLGGKGLALAVTKVPGDPTAAIASLATQLGGSPGQPKAVEINGATWQEVTMTTKESDRSSTVVILATAAGPSTLLVSASGPISSTDPDAVATSTKQNESLVLDVAKSITPL
jgi:pimeloyl-ACP methyl ester carboxylesterase